ncbi:Putative insertion sequence transposase protein [Neorhizobium galegae bv. orientalis]|nr:transposase [Neorhizobium galegae]CDZ61970.1 Putative insertion sequence transposase protein [Neorhizobium galegae bv. orientalis]
MAIDADNGQIIAHSLTDQDTGDASQVEPLLEKIDADIGQFTGDGAYDGDPTYNAILAHSPEARIVIPPRSTAVVRADAEPPSQRDLHIASIQAAGRLRWQAVTGYGKRALVETTMGRYTGIIGPRLRARSFAAQQTEAAIGVAILNQLLGAARPKSARCKANTASMA